MSASFGFGNVFPDTYEPTGDHERPQILAQTSVMINPRVVVENRRKEKTDAKFGEWTNESVLTIQAGDLVIIPIRKQESTPVEPATGPKFGESEPIGVLNGFVKPTTGANPEKELRMYYALAGAAATGYSYTPAQIDSIGLTVIVAGCVDHVNRHHRTLLQGEYLTWEVDTDEEQEPSFERGMPSKRFRVPTNKILKIKLVPAERGDPIVARAASDIPVGSRGRIQLLP